MNRAGHQAAAQAAWLTAAALHPGLSITEIICGAVVASSMAADDWSPDADQRGWMADLIPGGHRGVTHMPEVVALALWGVIHVTTEAGFGWFGWAAAAAWGSHLLVDAGWGRIPSLLLGGRRIGFKLNTGGPTEKAATWLMAVGCVPLLWWALGMPGA